MQIAECVRKLKCHPQEHLVVQRQRMPVQRMTFDILHDKILSPVLRKTIKDAHDVGMLERLKNLRFAMEVRDILRGCAFNAHLLESQLLRRAI